MAKVMLVVSDVGRLKRIPALLEQAAIAFEKRESGENTFYYCKEDKTEVWVTVAPKQSGPGHPGAPAPKPFFPVFVFPRPGFFRSWFRGRGDRRLQERILTALEPIKDLEFVLKM